ncbi:SusC/RagA family TonB-linked outer membrane protein [Pedobacter frigoris]|uniref:SusC/RagA family TonB-linked outer membrane protein n=1 Tax=Pedobacter frigoris TaxID=2571272 RepID=UPI0029308D28|nr:SusC/RagA family TonB-linked outer membrane protein [Pedobacter frigoris]
MLKILLVMRIIVFLLTTAILQVSASTYGQNVTIRQNNADLAKVIRELRKQTGFDFVYSDKMMESAKPVSLNLNNVPFEQALEICFKNQPLTFSIADKIVTVKEKTPSFLDLPKPAFVFIDIRGKILDENRKPLEGATITVYNSKGFNKSVLSNEIGAFSILGVPDDVKLIITYVGYKTIDLIAKDAVMPLEIKLNSQTGELEEVSITYSTGYENIPKERATGSFVQIENKLLQRTVSTNILDRIMEVTSGLRNENGNRASMTNISVRGFSTINSNMKPLIVIDGFPYEEQNSSSEFLTEILLNNLNPNDVENVTILRDAAAASIWGTRSGNGVIVITTKKGKYNQQANVNFNSSVNIVEKPRLDKMKVINPMDAIEIEKKLFATGRYNYYDDLYPSFDYFSDPLSPAIELMLAARKQHLATPDYNALDDPEVIDKLYTMGSFDVRKDISKYLLRAGVNQQYAFNISGGTDKMKYYSSVGYDNNLPFEKGNEDNRLTLNFNSTFRPIKNLELNAYLVYTKNKNVKNGVGYTDYLPGRGSVVAPYTRLADNSGNSLHVSRIGRGYRKAYLDTANYPRLLDWSYRPLDEIGNNDNNSNSYSTRFGGGFKYQLIHELNIAVNSQYEKSLSNADNYQNLKNYETRNSINKFMQVGSDGILIYPVPMGGILDYTDGELTRWNLRGQLNFNKVWGKHQITAIAGTEIGETIYNYNFGRIYGYDFNSATIVSNLDYNSTFPVRGSGGGSTSLPQNAQLGGNLNRLLSYFANGAYTFNNKYTVTGSGRVDAGNFLGAKANQHFTPLWSSGVSWDISREDFYSLEFLPYLKIKMTYGYNGNLNNRATALPTAQYRSPQAGFWHNEISLLLLTPPNPGFTWERVRTVNLGVDFGSLNNRLTGSLEYYTKRSTDLIGSKVVEATAGVSSYIGNYANMISKGFDLRLNSINIDRQLTWQTSLNFSYSTDKITKYELTANDENSVESRLDNQIPILNLPLFKVYSYPDAGLDPINGNPRGYINGEVKDFNEFLLNAKPKDLLYHGSAVPKIFGNILNNFDYKQFSLSFNIGFRFNYFVRRKSIFYSEAYGKWGNGHSDYKLRWQKPGDEKITNVPSLPDILDNRDNFYTYSSSLVVKGDNIRLNDIRLSYAINKARFKKLPFANATFSLSATNLGILWRANKVGVDPDMPDNSQPPISRNIALSLNLNF